MAILEILRVAGPLFESVTAWATLVVPTFWLLNVSELGARLGSAVPVPERLAVCGLLVALSVTVKVPLRVPVAVGVKVTLIVQDAPAATELPQLFVSAKSPLLAPVMAMPDIASGAFPAFERVAVWYPLVV